MVISKGNRDGSAVSLLTEVKNKLQDLKPREVFELTTKDLEKVDILLNRIKSLTERFSATKSTSGKSIQSLTSRLKDFESKIQAISEFEKLFNELNKELVSIERNLPSIDDRMAALQSVIKSFNKPKLLEQEGLSVKLSAIKSRIRGIEKIEKSF